MQDLICTIFFPVIRCFSTDLKQGTKVHSPSFLWKNVLFPIRFKFIDRPRSVRLLPLPLNSDVPSPKLIINLVGVIVVASPGKATFILSIRLNEIMAVFSS